MTRILRILPATNPLRVISTAALFMPRVLVRTCSVLISHADWWSGFLVFEGTAELAHSGNTGPEELRTARRHIFSATTRRRSADWDEYDRIANEDKRVAMVLRPDHVYGTAVARMRAALAK